MEPDPPEPPPEPPANAAIGWLRFIIWLVPAGVAVALVFVSGYLGQRFGLPGAGMGLWLLVWAGVTYAIGWFDAQFSRRRARNGIPVWGHAATFVMLQLLVVPAVGGFLLFGVCVFSGAF